MAVGVAVANSILLVAFAEKARQSGMGSAEGACLGAEERLRPILMTSIAMILGMIPLALALAIGGGSEQSAPMGRAVIGGITAATVASLVVLPVIFTVVMKPSKIGTASLHPDDVGSAHYDPVPAAGASHHHEHEPAPAHEEGVQDLAPPQHLPPQTIQGDGSPSSPNAGPNTES
jgi:hypothetical protein